jgi:translation initiation factor 2 beta subunit (eIF-2beta)/eIF-5
MFNLYRYNFNSNQLAQNSSSQKKFGFNNCLCVLTPFLCKEVTYASNLKKKKQTIRRKMYIKVKIEQKKVFYLVR